MKPRCIAAVNAAAGRALTPAQLAGVEAAITKTAKRLAKADRQRWTSLSEDQRTIEAGVEAVKDLKREAALKKYRQTLQVLKTAETEQRVTDQMRVRNTDRGQGFAADMQISQDYIGGIKDRTMSDLHDLIEAAGSTEGAGVGRKAAMFLFDTENPAMTRDLALEIFRKADGSTGNSLAKKGADAWIKTIEPLRQRFNAAGGDVGQVEAGYLPNLHDATKTLRAGADAWVDKTLPRLDRKQYVNRDGTSMDEGQLRTFLRAAWETITTEGQNKTAPGQFQGTGARANAGSLGREIHFKDGEAWLEHHAEFGRGSLYEGIIGHVHSMAKSIGLVERYGPNPETQAALQRDLATREAGRAPGDDPRVFGTRLESQWKVLSGATGVPQNAMIARIGSSARASQTAGKLGAAVISSITDLPTYFLTTGFNKLSYWDSIANIGRQASKDTREWAALHGVIGESMIGDLNRFSGDHVSATFASRMAQSTLKLSGLNAWTDTLRNAFQITMMQGLARMSRTDWAKLSEFDRNRMERHGLTESDWKVMQSAAPEQRNGLDFLTPQSIEATAHPESAQIVSKVLGLIKNEGETAVLNPDLATRSLSTGGGMQAGTVHGELARSVMQFKSFPLAMISRHWRRIWDTPDVEGRPVIGNPVAYSIALGVSLTALGAIALQAKQIIAGKDPIDMVGPHAAKFWTQAFVQGGGASIVGDMFLKDTTEGGTGFAAATGKVLLGPAIGTLLDAGATLKDNADKALKGMKTHTGADLVRVAKQNFPLVNLWYTKALVDHLGLNALQENLSPGYLSKLQQKAQKEWGQGYWWRPGTGAPARAPDLGKAVGR